VSTKTCEPSREFICFSSILTEFLAVIISVYLGSSDRVVTLGGGFVLYLQHIWKSIPVVQGHQFDFYRGFSSNASFDSSVHCSRGNFCWVMNSPPLDTTLQSISLERCIFNF
jgi:hypothetical protein